jgi:hypothetical protein
MAFNNCTNCDAKISCSCEYQIAQDGTECCDMCVGNYDLAMSLAQAIVETVPTKKQTIDDESEFPGGDNLPTDDEEPKIF